MSDFPDRIEPEAKPVIGDAAENLSDRASDLYETALDASKKSAEEISAYVQQKPIISVLLAFGAGFVFSRMLRR
jgi:ElaB/YqjD/DUF883 family membrane-anchored ribosome-binding protein